jgi:hypothetical protein
MTLSWQNLLMLEESRENHQPATSNLQILSMVGWFMVFNATFNNISVISWWDFIDYLLNSPLIFTQQ